MPHDHSHEAAQRPVLAQRSGFSVSLIQMSAGLRLAVAFGLVVMLWALLFWVLG